MNNNRMTIPVAIKQTDLNTYIISAGNEQITFQGSIFSFTSTGRCDYNIDSCTEPYLHYTADITAKESVMISKITWFDGVFSDFTESAVQHTNYNDNFLFIRKNKISFVFSLDFPSSKISEHSVLYCPNKELTAGENYAAHSITIFACELVNKPRGEFDFAEIEAASEYIENRFPIRFNRPMFLSACITNRMTYMREHRVFYSLYDNPTLESDLDTLLAEVDLNEELGIEYHQIFEGVFDWVDSEKASRNLTKLVDYAKDKGVKIGDYVHPGELYCPHYNYEGRMVEKHEWRQIKENGEEGHLCLGCKEYLEFLKERLVKHCRKHGERFYNLDMLCIEPCHNPAHNHPMGDVYAQVAGLVEIFTALNEISDDFMCWTNCGNWIEYVPKLVWYNQNIYLTDPHVRQFIPSLSSLKYLGDCRREQMVTVHEKYMVPYRFFSNCEYYFSPRSRVSDIKTYEYSLLQSLAVTPNVCFAELRTFINRMPSAEVEKFKVFVKKWLNFLKDNYFYWAQTLRCGDPPGTANAEIYSHIKNDRGYICLVNQNYHSAPVTLSLDESVGLMSGDKITIKKIYPEEYPLYEAGIPYSRYGDQISLTVPPQSVIYLSVTPYAEVDAPLLFGANGTIRKTATGYQIDLVDAQGTEKPIALVLPKGQTVTKATATHQYFAKLFTFDANVKIVENQHNICKMLLKFPLSSATTELSFWSSENGEQITLPYDPLSFNGAVITGCHAEQFHVRLEVEVTNSAKQIEEVVLPPITIATSEAKQDTIFTDEPIHLSTSFYIPFIEPTEYSMQPAYDDDCVLHLAFDHPDRISAISAQINGCPVDVLTYHNPLQRGWVSYYIDLTGNVNPGDSKLDLIFKYQSES